MDKIVGWYVVGGFITLIIGVIRFHMGKQSEEPDFLLVFSWFFAWFIFLGVLIGNNIYKFLKYLKWIK